MFIDISGDSFSHVCIIADMAFLRGKKQKLRQYVGQIFGHKGLFYDTAVIKNLENTGHFPQNRIRIRKGKNIADAGGDAGIISPCDRAVKMASQALAAGGGGVAVLFVTVKENKAAGGSVCLFALEG